MMVVLGWGLCLVVGGARDASFYIGISKHLTRNNEPFSSSVL